jgi:sarcosine oxidase subunit gamma
MVKLKNIPGQSALSGITAKSSPAPEGSSGMVVVTDLGIIDKINLRCQPNNTIVLNTVKRVVGVDLPITYNRFNHASLRSCIWLGPDEWLILGENGAADDIIAELDVPESSHVAVTDVSDAFGSVMIEGVHARDVLAKHCAIDLHPLAFTSGMAAQTLLARAGIILTCLEDNKMMMLGRTSFMAYILDLLEDAALEYGFRYNPAD